MRNVTNFSLLKISSCGMKFWSFGEVFFSSPEIRPCRETHIKPSEEIPLETDPDHGRDEEDNPQKTHGIKWEALKIFFTLS